MRVDVATWTARNAWRLPSGELAARSSAITVASASAGRAWAYAFTVRNQRTDVVWHYVVDVATSAPYGCIIRIFDENMVEWQSYSTGSSGTPVAVTHAVVEDQIVIASPSFATVWGLVGGGLTRAVAVDSANPNTTALEVPRGLCVAWGARVVIASSAGIYFGDALAPRTFVAENVVDPPGGAIYGLHVTAGGALVICTATGVYALPIEAAASGQIVVGTFDRLSDYACVAHGTTAESRGVLWGLTKRGFRRIDGGSSDEVALDEPLQPRRASGGRVAFPDYRRGRLLPGALGPIVAIGSYVHMVDLEGKVRSWWTFTAPVGLLVDQGGDELHVTSAAVYRYRGNTTAAGDTPVAGLAGRVEAPPDASPVVRSVDWATDGAGAIAAHLNGSTLGSTTAPQESPVIGTDSWDAASLTYREAPLRSRRFDAASRTDEIALELESTGAEVRLGPAIDVGTAGPGKRRRTG